MPRKVIFNEEETAYLIFLFNGCTNQSLKTNKAFIVSKFNEQFSRKISYTTLNKYFITINKIKRDLSDYSNLLFKKIKKKCFSR